MKNKMIKFLTACVLISALFIQCKDETGIQKQEKTEGVSVSNNGYLVFKSKDAFDNYIKSGNIDSINNELGFTSQQMFMEKIIKAEEKQDIINEESFKKTAGEDPSKFDIRSNEYLDALNKGLIKVYKEGTEDECWDLPVCSHATIGFTNKNGLFQIDSSLYKIDENSITKTRLNSGKVEVLYDKSLKSDYRRNDSNTATSGKNRITLSIELNTFELLYSPKNTDVYVRYSYFHHMHVKLLKKNWLGRWKRDSYKSVDLSGSWFIEAINGRICRGSYFSKHYSQLNEITLSLNPGTGTTHNSGTSFYSGKYISVLSCPSISECHERAPYYTDYNFTARRNDCNLTAKVTMGY